MSRFLPPWGLLGKLVAEQQAEYDAEQRGEMLIRDEHNMIIGSVRLYPSNRLRPRRKGEPRHSRRTGAPSKYSPTRSGRSRKGKRCKPGYYYNRKARRCMKSKFR
jgi:hypothetical protein